jgi:hypothetical protein
MADSKQLIWALDQINLMASGEFELIDQTRILKEIAKVAKAELANVSHSERREAW